MSAIATVVYSTVLTNQLTTNVPAKMGQAATAAGMNAANVPELILALQTGNTTALSQIPRATTQVIQAAMEGLRVASASSYRVVYFVSIAFSAVGVVASCFTQDPRALLNAKVAATVGEISSTEEKKAVIT